MLGKRPSTVIKLDGVKDFVVQAKATQDGVSHGPSTE